MDPIRSKLIFNTTTRKILDVRSAWNRRFNQRTKRIPCCCQVQKTGQAAGKEEERLITWKGVRDPRTRPSKKRAANRSWMKSPRLPSRKTGDMCVTVYSTWAFEIIERIDYLPQYLHMYVFWFPRFVVPSLYYILFASNSFINYSM